MKKESPWKLAKQILIYGKKGVFYASCFAFVGIPFGDIMNWPFPKGSYVLIFGVATLSMFLAIVGFVGTPKMRMAFFARLRMIEGKPTHLSDDEVDTLGAFGVKPAVIGVVMMGIGFLLEAYFH